MNSSTSMPMLRCMARLYGIETSYLDTDNNRHQASVDTILTVLKEMGVPLTGFSDIDSAWRECRQQILQRPVPPVILAWDGKLSALILRFPSGIDSSAVYGSIVTEEENPRTWKWRGNDMIFIAETGHEGIRYKTAKLPFPERLPSGYHRLTLEYGKKTLESLIIAAPARAYEGNTAERTWGAFIPLYALHTKQSWGAGNFSDLASLAEFIAEKGGRAVGTLPLLAAFLDEPFQPSPYLPVSRLFWNEFYLDIDRIPELRECPPAQAILESCRKEIKCLQALPLVDYRCQMELKRRVLTELCRFFFMSNSLRKKEFENFLRVRPEVEQYARFRTVQEKQRASWHSWPPGLRDGIIREGNYDAVTMRYHLYVQWLAQEQITNVAASAREKGTCLYLDIPLGVHPDGYDVWRNPSVFARGFSVGAPPDSFFAGGQDWSFPPVHPVKIREQGYRYVIDYLRHNFRHAGMIRIDHVMGLHRLFWIARGDEVSHGIYVRNRADELYAILSLESHRHKTMLVGEDLGTVSPAVRPAMARRGLKRMYVLNFEISSGPDSAINLPLPDTVAGLNTHDTPPFAAFWQELDIKNRVELGSLDKAGAKAERQTRRELKKALLAFLVRQGLLEQSVITDIGSVFKACLAFLSKSDAMMVIVNLEDLWLEEKPQNMPGTNNEHDNWRRKARYSLEELGQLPKVLELLQYVNGFRKKRRV